MKLLLFFVRRFLFNNTKDSFRSSVILFSMAGIFFATCMVLVALGILFGYQKVYQQAVLSFSAHVIVTQQAGISESERGTVEQILNEISETSVAIDYSPYHFYETLVPGKNRLQTIIFKGVDFSKLKSVYPVEYRYFQKKNLETNGVIVGNDIQVYQDKLFQTRQLQYLSINDRFGNAQTKLAKMPVIGTFSSGYFDFDSRFVLMPIDWMLKSFFSSDVISGFEIRLKDLSQMTILTDILHEKLGDDFQIITWKELNKSLFDALTIDRTVVFSVSFLVLLIACLNIFGFNFLFFMERKREFMILSALGFGMTNMRRLLSLLSLCLGGLAAFLGSLLSLFILYYLLYGKGVALNPEVYYVSKLPVAFNVYWFLVFLFASMALCFVTSILAGRVIVKRWMTANLTA